MHQYMYNFLGSSVTSNIYSQVTPFSTLVLNKHRPVGLKEVRKLQ
jgi:hypothetical protein